MQLRDLPRDILFYVSRNSFRELNVKIIAEKVEGAARKILPPPRALIRFCRKICLTGREFERIRRGDVINHRPLFSTRPRNFISARDSFAAPIAQNRGESKDNLNRGAIVFHLGIWFRRRIRSRETVSGRRCSIVRASETHECNPHQRWI